MNLGFDFGSTYSMLSYYDPVDDAVKAVQSLEGSKYIPSIACFDYDENIITGQSAKDLLASEPERQAFRAFKMLLPECDCEKLRKRGYTEECSPQYVAKEFIKQQMELAKDYCSTERFENLIICIPAVWNTELYTMSGKAILRDICRELDMADKVTVVTEPAAASAYFAYNYNKNTKKLYDGLILIVDYGGGTLDITLTKVNTVEREDGVQSMEIDVLGQTGAGENHGDNLGDAGIAYMEGVVKLAIEKNGIPTPEYDGYFLKALNFLESALIRNSRALSDRLRRKYGNVAERMATDESPFTTLSYKGKPIKVTYSTLYEAYDKIIKPVLAEQLDRVNEEYLKLENIDKYTASDGFKIALVGGFGQFFLVQKQVWDYFRISDTVSDYRLQNLSYAPGQNGQSLDSGKEDAISYGAALISSGVITMRKTAKLSVGLFTTRNGEETFDFAIKYRSELEYGKVSYLNKSIFYSGRSSSDPSKSPWVFAIGQGKNFNKAYRMVPLKEKQALLEKIATGSYTFGFSVDESDVYTFHVVPLDMETNEKLEDKATKMSLGNFSDIFGPNVIYEEKNAFFKKDD